MNRILLCIFLFSSIKIALTQDTTYVYDESGRVTLIRYTNNRNKFNGKKIDTALYYTDSLNYAIVKEHRILIKKERLLRSKYYEFTDSYRCKNGISIDTFFHHSFDDFSNTIIELRISKGSYKNGKAHGDFFVMHDQDTVIQGKHRNGLLHGDIFDKLLNLNCNPYDTTGFYEQHIGSQIYTYGKYKNGDRVGEWKYYFNDILIAKGKYANKGARLKLDYVNEQLYKVQKKDTIMAYDSYSNDKMNYYEESVFGVRIIPIGNYLRKGRWDFFSLDGSPVKSLYYNKHGKIKRTEVKKEIPLEYFFCIR